MPRKKKNILKKSIKGIQETAEDITEDITEGIKKINWKKVILITSSSILIISLILFFVGLNIRFAAKDDLLLYLDPSERSFKILNHDSQDVTFELTNRNSILCSAECSYLLYDRSEGNQLDNGSFSLKNKEAFSKSYTLLPYRSGSGQRIYSFEVSCNNIRTALCRTYSPLRKRTSFITLNYELSTEEKEIKNVLGPELVKSLKDINNGHSLMQKSRYLKNISRIPIDSYSILDDTSKEYLNTSLIKAKEVVDLWEKEEYLILNKTYELSLIPNISRLKSSSSELYNLTLSFIEEQNKLITEYNENLDTTNLILNSKKAQFLENNSLFVASKQTLHLLSKINLFNYSDILTLHEDLIYLEEKISSLNSFIDNEYEERLNYSSSLLKKELSKKCYLGYCENKSGEICTLFSEIINNYQSSNFTFSSGLNITQSYYTKLNSTSLTILPENESISFLDESCSNSSSLNLNMTKITKINISRLSLLPTKDIISSNISDNPPLCCVLGKCTPCCTVDTCNDDERLYPAVFIHGHSLIRETSPEPLSDGFNKIQYALQEDGYLNAGTLLFDFDITNSTKNEWGLANTPITVKASYYYDYFYTIGSYVYLTRSGENIDTYAIRLNDIINLVKYKTGKEKVNIIAHSMGGLVVRRYLQIFEKDTINKLILIGTPNKGIVGDVKDFCHIFGEKRECEDMYNGSIFMKKLNSPIVDKPNASVYTISGKGCNTNGGKDGDGVVVFENSLIDYAESYIIDGNCTDPFGKSLHVDLLDIDMYPKTYEYLAEILDLN